MTLLSNKIRLLLFLVAALGLCSGTAALGGQGAQRMLYTVPNNTFIESPAGDSVVTITDTSGSVATLQSLINNARSANPNSIIVVHLLNGATYWVGSTGLTLGSQECLIGTGALLKATNLAVTVPLITITNGATNVSIAGGTLDANGANIYGIYAPSSSARVNLDKVTVRNCGQDCIQLNGNGSGTFDNEMTVTRCDVSGSPSHSGISIWNATQTTCVDDNCHNNSVGLWLANCGYGNIANNTCVSNMTGIYFSSGNDNYLANNTCNHNGTGIVADGSSSLIVSDSFASNTVAGINSSGSGNIYVDNMFAAGNAANFLNGGSGDEVVAYQGALSASGQNYFYPPLIDNQHSTTIVNGLGRYDLYDSSTGPIDNVQSEYNAALSANPGDVIVLHLNGSYTVGANPLTLASDTCVLLGGTIQINSLTTASCAVTASSGASYISISGGIIDGGTSSPPSKGRDAIYFSGIGMFQIDAVTMQHFGNNSSRVGGSDVVRIDHGSTPRIITRCTINGGSARGIWVATSGVRDVVSDNTVTDVQMDGVDCDESTYASLVKFNYLYDNGRYGVFLEQSASDNLVLGNVCNYNSSYDIGCYNNSTTARGATADNSIICNSLLGDNGLRNGSTGDGDSVTSSDNFFFNNTVMNANIQSQLYGSQNYYSQNYMGNSSLSTSGTEVFFNPPDVSGNLQLQASNSGLDAVVTNAATSNGAAVITSLETGLGNDLWQLLPTDSGYYRLMNENSGLALVVLDASTNHGAGIIQWTYDASGNDEWMPVSAGNGFYNFVNRLSGLYLDVPGARTNAGTQLDQQSATGDANQQFNLVDSSPPTAIVIGQSAISWTGGGAPDGNWQNAANWGENLPKPGDWLTFGSGFQLLTTNNFSTGTIFGNVAFGVSSPSFILNGNGLVLAGATEDANGNISGGTITVGSVSNQAINLPVTLAAGNHAIATAGGAGSLTLPGAFLANAGATVQFDTSGGPINCSLTNNAAGVIGGWALFTPSSSSLINNNQNGGALVDWAAAGSGAVTAFGSYTTLSGNAAKIVNSPASNVKITSGGTSGNDDTMNASGTTTINTLYYDGGSFAGSTYLDIPTGDILRFGAQGGLIANLNHFLRIGNNEGSVTAGGAANTPGQFYVYNFSAYNSGQIEFWCNITDNGAGYPVSLIFYGSAELDNANSYSGGTYVNAGELYQNGGGDVFGYGPIYVYPGGRVDCGGQNGETITNSFYLSGYGFLAGNYPGAIKGIFNGTFTGPFTLLGNASIDPNAGSGTNTCNFTGPFGGTGSLTIAGPSSSYVAGTATFAGTNSYSGDAIVDASANNNGGAGLRFAAGKNNLMQNGGNVVLIGGTSGVAGLDLNGTTQTINGLIATNGATTNALVKSSTSGATLVVGNHNASSTFAGTIQNGGGTVALTKTGGGTLTLTGRNLYTGNTMVTSGTLALSGSGSISNTATITIAAGATLDASGRADQSLTLNNAQALEGGGTVNVNLTVGAGATILPGNTTNLGTLTIAGAAQLQGATIMKLNATAGTSDQLDASSFLYGGSLTVTNASGTLAAGQSFQLFEGDTYSGAFTVTNLPPLGAGLAWSNCLAAGGTLQVIATMNPQPVFTRVVLSGANLILGGTNGLTGQPYVLLASTNLAAPLDQWIPLLTNAFVNGSFSATNAINPTAAPCFYLLKLP